MKSRGGNPRREESEKRREEKKRREKISVEKESEERRSRHAKRQESRETLCFPMICGSGGSKSRLAKAAGEPSGQMRDEKLHAAVARSTFRSQNAQNTSASDHSWKLRCRKSARRCGAKHISKSKCTKHTVLGPLLEVEMSKKCTPLWRSTFRSQNVQNTPRSDHFWTFRFRFAWQAQGIVHLVKSEQNVRVL